MIDHAVSQLEVTSMIKRIKNFQADALINSDTFRDFVEKSESEILRGISTLVTLKIIELKGEDGVYGYELLKELETKTKSMLMIEEGTLYPLLRNLEKTGLLTSNRKTVSNRRRKYYYITPEGRQVQRHLNGFFAKLIESMSDLLDIGVELKEEGFLYCPNCANKVDLLDPHVKFCEVCGLNIESYINADNVKQKLRKESN